VSAENCSGGCFGLNLVGNVLLVVLLFQSVLVESIDESDAGTSL